MSETEKLPKIPNYTMRLRDSVLCGIKLFAKYHASTITPDMLRGAFGSTEFAKLCKSGSGDAGCHACLYGIPLSDIRNVLDGLVLSHQLRQFFTLTNPRDKNQSVIATSPKFMTSILRPENEDPKHPDHYFVYMPDGSRFTISRYGRCAVTYIIPNDFAQKLINDDYSDGGIYLYNAKNHQDRSMTKAVKILKNAKKLIKNEHMIPKPSHYLHMDDLTTRSNVRNSLLKARSILETHLETSHVSHPYSEHVLDDVQYALRDLV